MTKLMMPVFYPFIANDEMKIPFMKKKMDKMLAEDNGYIRAFMDMIKTPDVDMSHITKKKRRKPVLLRPHYTAAGSDRPVRNADTYFICP